MVLILFISVFVFCFIINISYLLKSLDKANKKNTENKFS